MSRRLEAFVVSMALALSLSSGAWGQEQEGPAAMAAWCSELRKEVKSFRWKVDPCENLQWKSGGMSIEGRPLLYAEFGDPQSPNVTLVLSMVHPDEITPLYLALKMAHWMRDNQDTFSKLRVVIAPLVNPDGFYNRPKTRTNARGVDVNRNLPTSDWQSTARKLWKEKYKSNPRRNPGLEPSSEPETDFQEELIRLVKPTKILSIHSPLNFMDYDGPSNLALAKFPKDYVQKCLKLKQTLKAASTGFFPGSLGNYAGQELGIPTVTLELPTADPAKAEGYWYNFKRGIRAMIEFSVPGVALQASPNPET